jgi:hypothetical protein
MRATCEVYAMHGDLDWCRLRRQMSPCPLHACMSSSHVRTARPLSGLHAPGAIALASGGIMAGNMIFRGLLPPPWGRGPSPIALPNGDHRSPNRADDRFIKSH